MPAITHILSVPLVPADAAAAVKLRAAIDELRAADPTLSLAIGPVEEIELQGFSEPQMDHAVDMLKRGKGLEFKVGAPTVRYCEIIRKTVVWDYTHQRQGGGSSEYARVKIRLTPGERGSGFVFANAARDGAVPERFVLAIEKSLARVKGVIANFPLTDIRCTLVDGGYHPDDSTEQVFGIAARACLCEALPKARPSVIEPVMHVTVLTPQAHMGDVIGSLNSRRGQVTGMEPSDGLEAITAFVPLANLFGYIPALSDLTQGRASCTMTYSHYEQVPPSVDPGDDNFPPAVGMRA